ncbi:DUF6968 family protein [Brevundimonas lenta]|uniref:DUF6968 domain-containing protein n=1 Tax=Brevundimonas lenta TaxID=424796 RepID=A0A7W6JD64_9CAUL|nr:hypothetical protein [Brevundimonas lenta]MBB4082871.1 hypothetical protein [Brevundimonas lenta]
MNGPAAAARTEPSVACERLFQLALPAEPRPFRAVWMQPVPDGKDWACEYVIEWPHRPWRPRRIKGVDSAQALLLAMKMVASELYGADPQVFWFEPDDTLGLPLVPEDADEEAARTKGRI